jgi:hypothetical protein
MVKKTIGDEVADFMIWMGDGRFDNGYVLTCRSDLARNLYRMRFAILWQFVISAPEISFEGALILFSK